MRAILIGATGRVGRALTSMLLKSSGTSQENRVTVIVRRIPDNPQAFFNVSDEEITRLSIRVVDDFKQFDFETVFNDTENFTHGFSTMGTTNSQTPDFQEYYEIDHDIPLRFASAAKAAGVPFFSIVTSMGASPSSSLRYLKMKGEIEKDLIALNFSTLCILRPGILTSDPVDSTAPWYEKVMAKFIFPIIEFVFPKKYTVSINDVARTMVQFATKTAPAEQSPLMILENQEIIELAFAN